MRIRRSILFFGAAIFVLIALILWQGKKSKEALSTTAAETNSSPQAAARSTPTPTVKSNVPIVTANPGITNPSPHTENKAEQAINVLSTYNDVPIDFYGKVEDQVGGPVADATINFGVRIYNGSNSTVKHGQVTTDGNGFFTIKGYHGQELGLAPHKAGYSLATTETLFKYSHMEEHPFVSDPNNPTVIKMWKLQGAESLININKEYKIPFTSDPVIFDLIAGKLVASGGDIKIKVNRPSGEISERRPQKWSITFEVINGGFIPTSGSEAAVTFIAPEQGYEASTNFDNNN